MDDDYNLGKQPVEGCCFQFGFKGGDTDIGCGGVDIDEIDPSAAIQPAISRCDERDRGGRQVAAVLLWQRLRRDRHRNRRRDPARLMSDSPFEGAETAKIANTATYPLGEVANGFGDLARKVGDLANQNWRPRQVTKAARASPIPVAVGATR